MKSSTHLLSFASLVASAIVTHAATHTVLPRASVQEKINIAQAGDIIAIFGGIYYENITVNKAVRLVEVNGEQVTFVGNLTFSNVTDCPPLVGFTVGSSGRGISVINTTNLVFRNIDARAGSGITSSGTSTLKISDSQLSNCVFGGAAAEVGKSSIAGRINHTSGDLSVSAVTIAEDFDTQESAQKTLVFRTKVNGDCNWKSKKNWFGYSEARSFNFANQSDGRVVVIGNKIDRKGAEANGIFCNVNNSKIDIFNNQIIGVGYNYAGDSENGIDLRGAGNVAVVANNYCSLSFYGNNWNSPQGDGISIRGFSRATVINNLVVGARYGVSAPFGVLAANNLYWASPWNTQDGGDVIAEETVYDNPLFVENEAPKLQPTSPCLNAGTPDPRYNNRDGSRNTIGPSGGPWIDPDGWTTENPVVISFDLSPDMVLEGVDTEVILSEGQAVSAP